MSTLAALTDVLRLKQVCRLLICQACACVRACVCVYKRGFDTLPTSSTYGENREREWGEGGEETLIVVVFALRNVGLQGCYGDPKNS